MMSGASVVMRTILMLIGIRVIIAGMRRLMPSSGREGNREMRALTQADQHRVNELRQRIGDGVPDTWLETAAVALNDKLAAEGDVELPNEPDAIVLALDVIIQEYGES